MSIEDALLEHLNFCRTSPAEYANRLEKYLSAGNVNSETMVSGTDFSLKDLSAAIEGLKKSVPAIELKWSNGLFLAAKRCMKGLKTPGPKFPKLSSEELLNTVSKYCKCSGALKENFSIGNNIEDLVVCLLGNGLIDSNIMKAEYKYVGITLKESKNHGKLAVIIFAEDVNDMPAENQEKSSKHRENSLNSAEFSELKEIFAQIRQGMSFSECKKSLEQSSLSVYIPPNAESLDFDGFLATLLNNISLRSSPKSFFSPIKGKSKMIDDISDLKDFSDSLESEHSIGEYDCFKSIPINAENESFSFNNQPFSSESSLNSKLDIGIYLGKVTDGDSVGSFLQGQTIESDKSNKT